MNLNIQDWKMFKVSKILNIINGRGITTEEIEENAGTFIVVQSGEENNGVLGKINLSYCKQMNYAFTERPCLTVARSGSAGFVSFQVNGCVVGDSAKILLLPDNIATIERYIFLQSVLSANRFKYTYGRKVTEEKYMNDWIALPIKYSENENPIIDETKSFSDEGYIPDWEYMDDYIRSLKYKPLTTINSPKCENKIKVDEWKNFLFGELIDEPYKGKAINKDDLLESNNKSEGIRYITRTGDNNGCEMIADTINIAEEYIESANAITIGDTTATCFYQEEQFITGDHMVVVRADWLNKYTGIFITALLNNEQYKYSYGRAFLMDRIKDTILKLPAKQVNGEAVPDWKYMENYIKSLPYGDRL